MTREEAIEFLQTDISRLGKSKWENFHKEALDMAIKALKQLSKVEDITHKWLKDDERYAEDRMWDIKAIVINNGEYR